MPASSGQFHHHRLEAMLGESIDGLTGLFLFHWRSQRLAQVPLYVKGQHAQETMGPHTVFGEMANGPHTDVHTLHGAEGPLHLRKALISDDGIFRREPILQSSYRSDQLFILRTTRSPPLKSKVAANREKDLADVV